MKNYKLNRNLISKMKSGDMAAFDEIYNCYCHRLHCFVLRYLKQKEVAEGVVQEVFIKVWEQRENINLELSFESYLFKIAYNTTISLLRKRLSDQVYKNQLEKNSVLTNSVDVIDEMQYQYLNKRVHELLNKATPRQREIFYLSRENGLSHKQIAEKLNISESTVKNHIVSTLAFLRENLDMGTLTTMLFYSLFLQ